MRRWAACAGTVAAVVGVVSTLVAAPASAEGPGFFTYSGSRPLSSFAPGEVIKTRTVPFHLAGIATPLTAVQVVYRSTNAMGEPVANATSVLRPPNGPVKGVLSYQSAYDSLNPADSPSRAVAGNFKLFDLTPRGRNIAVGNSFANTENSAVVSFLAGGYAVNIPDTEGQDANFAAGPEYGMNTLDSLRALKATARTGVPRAAKVALAGYSGGAIASNWAAILAPGYAPEINRDLIGVAQGGLLVNPARNLNYASGSIGWGGVVGMAIVGIARAYHIDFDPYTTPFGKQVARQLSDASILNAFYPGLRFSQLVRPQYRNPNSIPEYVTAANKVNMGTAPIPTIPMYIAQGANGVIEGTNPGPPNIGPGDGVMITGDVRALSHRYCDAGVAVRYEQYDLLSHIPTFLAWLANSVGWLLDRFNGEPAPNTCGAIAPAPAGALAPQVFTGPPAPGSGRTPK